jgi:hypothetical protein
VHYAAAVACSCGGRRGVAGIVEPGLLDPTAIWVWSELKAPSRPHRQVWRGSGSSSWERGSCAVGERARRRAFAYQSPTGSSMLNPSFSVFTCSLISRTPLLSRLTGVRLSKHFAGQRRSL